VRNLHRLERGTQAASRDLPKLRPVIVLAGILLVVAALYWTRAVLIPVAVATLLAFLLSPVVTALQRRGVRNTISVFLVVAMAVSALGGVGWIITAQVQNLASELPLYRENIKQKVADLRQAGRGTVIERFQRLLDEVLGEIQKQDPTAGPESRQEPLAVVVQPDRQAMLRQLGALVEPLVSAGLAIALTIFMLIRQVELRNRLIRLIGFGRLPVTTKAIDEAGERISQFLLAYSIINGSFGVAVGAGLFLIGLPYAVLFGFLAAILRFVPYLGAWLAALLPIGLSLVAFEGWWQPLLVAGLFVVLEPFIFLVVEPIFYGVRTGVSDVALLISIGFWAWLWGPVGLVLATPLTVCLVVLGKYVPGLEFFVVLMGDEPVLEPYVSYYQRLLAMDQDEAALIVEDFIRHHGANQVYDGVLLPALRYAKRDRAHGTLSSEDEQWILTATREIMESLGAARPEPAVAGPGPASATGTLDALPALRILGCPARDEADELALIMFQRLMADARCEVEVVSPALLASEVVTLARERRPSMICVAALPPGGLAHARYLIKRLRMVVPDAQILIGRWGRNGSGQEGRAMLVAAGADAVAPTLAETRDQVLQLLPVLTRPEAQPPSAGAFRLEGAARAGAGNRLRPGGTRLAAG
jgi:predicted PurR-regulated permease PerM